MITLTPTKTTLETNLERIDAPLKLIENKVRSACSDLNESLNMFWTLPEEELLEVLNSLGPQRVMEVFAAHERYATSFNNLLDDRGVDGIRAVIGKPVQLTINELGLFEIVKPEIVEEIVEEIIPPTEP